MACSSQHDEDCANLKRPEPARTCHLRPCATWFSGNWSKVSNLGHPVMSGFDKYMSLLLFPMRKVEQWVHKNVQTHTFSDSLPLADYL